ncbi:hypothetical protein SAMN02745166_05154 [Prosthecobacter debontii]|uniref:Uncharacterized protein n=2 Tax=Bacteria TaxID=2 RepID=A0A1T4RAC4_9FUSO|nr:MULTISPECIES: hypothetical protein [Bacteria]SKA12638.1 hypothetical protein SAMN02745174_02628 [Cetobacterium ceti]SKB09502.1 hypothetical protein SAMN02745166_05154 [Prosthecobacter debontii]
MEFEELKRNQNILANKLIEIDKKTLEYLKQVRTDEKEIEEREKYIKANIDKLEQITNKFEKYQKNFKRTNFLNKVFGIMIFLFLIFLIWGSVLIHSQKNQIKKLEEIIEITNDNIVEVLLGDRKFWVDNNDKINWSLIKNIPEEIKNSKLKNQKKGK